MSEQKNTKTATADAVAPEATAKPATRNMSLTLTPELEAQISEARWELREASMSGVVRHILELHFSNTK